MERTVSSKLYNSGLPPKVSLGKSQGRAFACGASEAMRACFGCDFVVGRRPRTFTKNASTINRSCAPRFAKRQTIHRFALPPVLDSLSVMSSHAACCCVAASKVQTIFSLPATGWLGHWSPINQFQPVSIRSVAGRGSKPKWRRRYAVKRP
jgi:hypothetical protein